MISDWNEIKRLAADFQRAQLNSTLQKLSEGNCVEIMCLIFEQKLTDVVFACDGKEYITIKHLEKEILDELYVNMGRVNLTEVATSLKINLSKISNIASNISKQNYRIHFILGQLMEEDYVKRIAQEINAELNYKGEINTSVLSDRFDLPSHFLHQNVIKRYLGTSIHGRQDSTTPSIFFTQIYFQRCKIKMKGTLAAITRPTSVATIVKQESFQEKLFYTILGETGHHGIVTTKFSNAFYIPRVYADMQLDWIRSYFKQNGLLEYETLLKLGITDANQFVKQHFSDDNIACLKRCAVCSRIVDLVLSVLHECNVACSFVDVSAVLPSTMLDEDIQDLLRTVLVSHNATNNFVCVRNIVFSNHFINKILKPCYDLAKNKAKEAIENGSYQTISSEMQLRLLGENTFCGREGLDRHKARKRVEICKQTISLQEVGGFHGQSKTKTTKKRGCKNGREEVKANQKNATNKTLELVKTEDIEKILSKILTDEGLGHVTGEVAKIYLTDINQAANQAAHELFEATSKTNIKLKRASMTEKLKALITDIRLYYEGLKFFSADVQSQMAKYLMKTLGNDISNILHVYLAMECNFNIFATTNLNADQRYQIAQELDDDHKAVLIELNTAMNKTVDEFILASQAALNVGDIILGKMDREKDQILVIEHKKKLCLQLSGTDDNASTLHLVTLILFIKITGCILHVSGRFVSHILKFIRPIISPAQHDLLMQYHGLVLQLLQTKEAYKENYALFKEISLLQTKVKDLALRYEN